MKVLDVLIFAFCLGLGLYFVAMTGESIRAIGFVMVLMALLTAALGTRYL